MIESEYGSAVHHIANALCKPLSHFSGGRFNNSHNKQPFMILDIKFFPMSTFTLLKPIIPDACQPDQ